MFLVVGENKLVMDNELLNSFVRVGITVPDEARTLYTAGLEQQVMRENLCDPEQRLPTHICRRIKPENPLEIVRKVQAEKKRIHGILHNSHEHEIFTDRDRAVAVSFSHEIENTEKSHKKVKSVSVKDATFTYAQRHKVKIEKRKLHMEPSQCIDGYTDMVRAASVTFGEFLLILVSKHPFSEVNQNFRQL